MKIEKNENVSRKFTASEIRSLDVLHNDGNPIIIEILGMPNSGKTHATQRIETILKRNCKLNIKVIYEAAHKCTISEKYNIDFNLWTACETIKLLLDSIDKKYDIIICERGVVDAINWVYTYFLDGRISSDQLNTLMAFYSFDRWFSLINYVLIFKCEIDVALQRENIYELESTFGSIVNSRVLNLIHDALNFSIEFLEANKKNYSVIDSSEQSQQQTNSNLFVLIMDYLMSLCK